MTIARARLIAFILTAAAAALSWNLPIYSGIRSSTGAQAATALAVFISFLPLVLPPFKRTAAVFLVVFSLLGAMTVGLLYLPGAIVMWLPERRPHPPRRTM